MRFLALSGLQTALFALLTAGTIIALYFLKLRHRRVFVSSSLLWSRVLDDRQSHALMEKLRRFISILIAVTIGLLIAVSLARPEIEALTGKNERIVIVMDTSPTMSALASDGKTRWEHALAQANSLLTSGGPTTEFRIADTTGRIASSFTTDRKEMRALLGKMKPAASESQFPKVDPTDSLVYLISDGVAVLAAPKEVKRVSVFEKARNVGITAFELRTRPSIPPVYDAFLEVQNFSGESVQAEITVSGAGGQRITRSVTLTAEEVFQETLDLTPFEGGPIRATVETKSDALAADDTAFAYLPIKRRSRTMLVTKGNNFLETILKLDSFVDLSVVDPANFKEGDVDAYVFDRFAPPTAPARPALIFGAPDVPWLRTPEGILQKPEITTWSESHPIMQFVSVHDMTINRAFKIDAKELTVVAAAGQAALIVASDRPKWVMAAFDLESTDFPLHIGFPIFIDNVLAWFSRDQLAVHRNPGTIDVPLQNAQVRSIENKVIPAQDQMGKTVFEALEPGLYTATQGDARMRVAVNLSNREFSDVNRSAFRNDTVPVSGQNFLKKELWFYMLFVAVVLVAGEWYTYHKRITL